MVWDLVVGFLLLLAASYIGTTMALRGFFGREYVDPRTGEFAGPGEDGEPEVGDRSGDGGGPTGGAASDEAGDDEADN